MARTRRTCTGLIAYGAIRADRATAWQRGRLPSLRRSIPRRAQDAPRGAPRYGYSGFVGRKRGVDVAQSAGKQSNSLVPPGQGRLRKVVVADRQPRRRDAARRPRDIVRARGLSAPWRRAPSQSHRTRTTSPAATAAGRVARDARTIDRRRFLVEPERSSGRSSSSWAVPTFL